METPSGKGAADENFPVASFLIAARLRPHVARFYAFARAIDDIADNPELDPTDKLRRLRAFGAALQGHRGADAPGLETAIRLRASLAATGVGAQHGLDLIDAFCQDAVKSRYRDWGELMHYCQRSAAPVGRYLLDLHGEATSGYPASDSLCNALQVLNHLQDCGVDYRRLDRVYLPGDWMDEAGVSVDVLGGTGTGADLRQVLNRTLDATDRLLEQAASLPGRLADRRLAAESDVIVAIARRLARRLRTGDPLAGRVVLGKLDLLACFAGALLRACRPRVRRGSPGRVPATRG